MPSLDTILDNLRQQYAAEIAEKSDRVRSQISSQLNQFLRRLRQYAAEQDFSRAVVDGAALFASGAGFFEIDGSDVLLRAEKGLRLEAGLRFPLDSARAFQHAVMVKELVVALRTPNEVGPALAGSTQATEREPVDAGRAVIIPIENADRVAALLFASAVTDSEGLDLIAGMASLILSRKQKRAGLAELAATTTLPPVAKPVKANFPAWAALNEEQKNLHWRAQRFARVKVAEWLLNKPEAGRAGLKQNDIYLFLKKEIDAARETFRNQFMGDRSMVDYLHLELVSAAAEGDEAKLGADYPGPLA